LTCPGSSCKLIIDENTVERLVDGTIFEKFVGKVDLIFLIDTKCFF
jgi:hypothetical protein